MRHNMIQIDKNIEDDIKKYFNYLLNITLTTVLAGFLMSIFILLSSIFYINDSLSFFASEISILLSLCIIPYICFKRFIYTELKFSEKISKLSIWIVSPILVSLIWADFQTSVHFMIIAISEEVLFREIYYQYLLKDNEKNKYHFIISMFLISFVFATVLHINENFFINIVLRFPLGILLFIIRHKFNLKNAILFHWLYDLIITLGV